jgi:hypothetical protein
MARCRTGFWPAGSTPAARTAEATQQGAPGDAGFFGDGLHGDIADCEGAGLGGAECGLDEVVGHAGDVRDLIA